MKVRESDDSPSFLWPVTIRMTNEEHIYLSFVHSLLREVPGLSQYLQAYGTNEASLINALEAAFQNAHSLLRYILRRMLQ